MALTIFEGFSQDFVLDFTGLKISQLRGYREAGVVKPPKKQQGYEYSFRDVLTLKLVHQLTVYGVKPINIKNASSYLGKINPEKSLLHHKLYIRSDTKEIIFFGTKTKHAINASKFGQLLVDGVLLILPVGEQLEKVRIHIVDFDRNVQRGLKQRKLIPFREALKQHGLG
jgi:DNA-binding transcriptional MerR regulator